MAFVTLGSLPHGVAEASWAPGVGLGVALGWPWGGLGVLGGFPWSPSGMPRRFSGHQGPFWGRIGPLGVTLVVLGFPFGVFFIFQACLAPSGCGWHLELYCDRPEAPMFFPAFPWLGNSVLKPILQFPEAVLRLI